MRALRIARYRQLALDLGQPGGEDRWAMLPEQARLRVLMLLAAMIAQSAVVPAPGQDEDRSG
jgi:hypothetical protein